MKQLKHCKRTLPNEELTLYGIEEELERTQNRNYTTHRIHRNT